MGMESTRRAGGEELLQHQAFVRRIAHELVRDAARADDLVQEAWVQALERPPRVAEAARAWFRTVLRNLARRGARAEGRRRDREGSVARSAAVPSSLEIGERLALEQELVRAVEGLHEPYRTAIFQRYFEDLSPTAIASREGVPVATVKTRLRRALESLREALDRSRGRQAWVLALVRLAGPKASVAPLLVPLLGAGLVVIGATAGLWRGSAVERGASTDVRAALPGSAEPGPTTSELSDPDAPLEEPVLQREVARPEQMPAHHEQRAAKPPSPAAWPREEPALVLRGRVLFKDSRGAGGAGVVFGPFRTETDARGGFQLAIFEPRAAEGPGREDGYSFASDTALVAYLDGWVPAVRAEFGTQVMKLLREEVRQVPPLELLLGGPALTLGGTVIERTGLPGEGWRIALLDGTPAHRDEYRPFSVEELASGASTHLQTGPDGRFDFRCLEAGRSYRVRAWNQGTLEQLISALTPAGTTDLVLRATDVGWRTFVEGVVVGLDDLPIPGVRCRLSMNEYRTENGAWMNSGQTVTTDAAGRFAFADVPPAEIFIRYDDSGASGEYDLSPDDPGHRLRLVLMRSGELVFEARDPRQGPWSLVVLDEAGEQLPLERDLGPGRSFSSRELPLSSDGTARARVSERACWLVPVRDGLELARLPLTIRHGENTLVRW